mmetsp:Transcript_50989/g.153291  ORF Transcript_50989/g.153291 Transcript_50989/m.153291 type:complete len:317 (-) Transcript_50989:14-964(-)
MNSIAFIFFRGWETFINDIMNFSHSHNPFNPLCLLLELSRYDKRDSFSLDVGMYSMSPWTCSALKAVSSRLSTDLDMSSYDILTLARMIPPLFARFGSMTFTATSCRGQTEDSPVVDERSRGPREEEGSCSFLWKSSANSASSITIRSTSGSSTTNAHTELRLTTSSLSQCTRVRRRSSVLARSLGLVSSLSPRKREPQQSLGRTPSLSIACFTASTDSPILIILENFACFGLSFPIWISSKTWALRPSLTMAWITASLGRPTLSILEYLAYSEMFSSGGGDESTVCVSMVMLFLGSWTILLSGCREDTRLERPLA